MQPLSFDPAVAGIGTQVAANGARGLAAGTATAAAASALPPAGAEEVSMQASMAFATEAVQAMGLNALAQEELTRAGAAFTEIAAIYSTVDGAAASTLA